jgi:hypothetical protein
VTGLAGADRKADCEVRFPGPGRPEEHHVLFPADEIQGAQVRDLVPSQASGMVEVELLQRFPAG